MDRKNSDNLVSWEIFPQKAAVVQSFKQAFKIWVIRVEPVQPSFPARSKGEARRLRRRVALEASLSASRRRRRCRRRRRRHRFAGKLGLHSAGSTQLTHILKAHGFALNLLWLGKNLPTNRGTALGEALVLIKG
jgi:hypothetical protein